MSRSVSIPSGAVDVAYADASWMEEEWDWDDAKDNLKYVARHHYPSLSSCDEWLGREDHAVLENGHCYITVSEYCGLVAVAIVPKDNPLAESWCSKVNLAPLAECFGQGLVSIARCSNGEQIFRAANEETVSSNGSRW